MPHPLPDDVSGVVGTRWFLVAVPDDPAYYRAALAVYTDLANYWKWGLEGPVPVDSDLAAQQWHDAIAETIGLIEMGFPETLLTYLDEIEPLLRAIRDKPICCEGLSFDTIGGDTNTGGGNDIFDGVGDPPETWGGGAVVDWPEWDSYKCGAAKELAKLPAITMARMGAISEHEGAAGWADLIAATLASLPVLGEPAEILWEFVANILDAGLDWAFDFDAAAAEIEGEEDFIACSIFEADGAEAAANAMKASVQGAISGTLARTLAGYFPYEMWATIVYTGVYEDENGNTVELSSVITPATDCCACPAYAPAQGGANTQTPSFVSIDSQTLADRERVNIRFNYDGSNYCGPERTIDTAVLVGPSTASRIAAFDQDENTIIDLGGTGVCNINPSVLNGLTVARVFVDRMTVCGDQFFDLEITFSD